MKALVATLALLIPASVLPSETKHVTGYIVVAHHCAQLGEVVVLIFNDGTFLAERAENIPEGAWINLANIRRQATDLTIVIKGPFDSCPTRS